MTPGDLQIRDNEDRMLQYLAAIAENTGGLGNEISAEETTEVQVEGSHSGDRVGHLLPKDYVVVETDDLDAANSDGTVTCEPGEATRLAHFNPGTPVSVLAVGATDEVDVEYYLEIDGKVVGGITNSPLGLLNTPFSFVDALGAAIPVDKRVSYIARLDASATGSVDLAARMHCEVLQ